MPFKDRGNGQLKIVHLFIHLFNIDIYRYLICLWNDCIFCGRYFLSNLLSPSRSDNRLDSGSSVSITDRAHCALAWPLVSAWTGVAPAAIPSTCTTCTICLAFIAWYLGCGTCLVWPGVVREPHRGLQVFTATVVGSVHIAPQGSSLVSSAQSGSFMLIIYLNTFGSCHEDCTRSQGRWGWSTGTHSSQGWRQLLSLLWHLATLWFPPLWWSPHQQCHRDDCQDHHQEQSW